MEKEPKQKEFRVVVATTVILEAKDEVSAVSQAFERLEKDLKTGEYTMQDLFSGNIEVRL